MFRVGNREIGPEISVIKVVQSVLKRPERAFPSFYSNKGKIGWGGRIRTFTVLINSEVSYQLDHAPAGCLRPGFVPRTLRY